MYVDLWRTLLWLPQSSRAAVHETSRAEGREMHPTAAMSHSPDESPFFCLPACLLLLHPSPSISGRTQVCLPWHLSFHQRISLLTVSTCALETMAATCRMAPVCIRHWPLHTKNIQLHVWGKIKALCVAASIWLQLVICPWGHFFGLLLRSNCYIAHACMLRSYESFMLTQKQRRFILGSNAVLYLKTICVLSFCFFPWGREVLSIFSQLFKNVSKSNDNICDLNNERGKCSKRVCLIWSNSLMKANSYTNAHALSCSLG